ARGAEGGVRRGWATLTAGARALPADRERRLGAAGAEADAAEAAAGAARRAVTGAAERDERARAGETAATRAEQQERTSLEDVVASIGDPRHAPATAPSDAPAAARLN